MKHKSMSCQSRLRLTTGLRLSSLLRSTSSNDLAVNALAVRPNLVLCPMDAAANQPVLSTAAYRAVLYLFLFLHALM